MKADAQLATTLTARRRAANTPTLDIVSAVHKATRRFMFETLVQVGAMDVTDSDDIDLTLNLLERLLEVLGEPRVRWHDAMHALRRGPGSRRRSIAAGLYRDLARLVGDQLARLERQESRALGLQAAEPLAARLQRLDDDELSSAVSWMGGALTPQELADLVDELHAASSAGRFHRALALLGERMDERRWNQLARALGVTQTSAPAPA